MKKLLTVFLLILSVSSFSQMTFVSVGISQSYFQNKNIDKIFTRYNNNGMGNFEPYKNISGPVFSFDFRNDGKMASMGYARRRKNITAEYIDSLNVNHAYTCQARYGYWFVNYYWLVVDNDRFKMGPGVGAAFSYYMFRKSGIIGDREYDAYNIITETHFLTSILFNMSIYMGEHISLNIQPHFQIPFFANTLVDYTTLEHDINPTYSIPDDQLNSYNEWHWNYGLTISLSIGGE